MRNKVFGVLKWWGILILGHAVSFLLFAMAFASMATQLQADGMLQNAYTLTLLFDLIFWAIFLFVCERFSLSSMERRRHMRVQLSECGSVISCIKKHYMSDLLIRWGVLLLNQLPVTIFYLSYSLSFEGISFVERIWISDIGFYAITGSALLGLLLLSLYMGLMLLLTRIVTLNRIKRF